MVKRAVDKEWLISIIIQLPIEFEIVGIHLFASIAFALPEFHEQDEFLPALKK